MKVMASLPTYTDYKGRYDEHERIPFVMVREIAVSLVHYSDDEKLASQVAVNHPLKYACRFESCHRSGFIEKLEFTYADPSSTAGLDRTETSLLV